MSHAGGGLETLRRSASPGTLKRKRDARLSPSTTTKSIKLHNTLSSSTSRQPSSDRVDANKQYRSPDSDEAHPSDSGDTSRGIDSSPPKQRSPTYAQSASAMATLNGAPHASASDRTPEPPMTQKERPQMLPPPGKAKGYRVVWDPELDGKLSKEERKRATLRKRDFGTEIYEPDPPPDPRLAIPGYMSGQCRAKDRPSKAIWRPAPYNLPLYKIDRYSVGPGEAQQVMVMGFDPFLPDATLRLNFSTFGSVASVQHKTDPDTGSFLGIALVKFRDGYRDGIECNAVESAKRAENEFNGSRIGLHTIRVEVDREGRKFKRHVESALRKARDERAKQRKASIAPATVSDEVVRPTNDSPAPPLNAPKGPSGKLSKPLGSTAPAVKPPEGPRGTAAAPSNPRSSSGPLIEVDLVLPKLKRKPYIHIPHASVPVLGTTIPHLKKRLKAYDWREVRLDKTGYYVIFEDSKRGEDETERCYNECNMAALFTYKMGMECQKYGNPDYERSPSPERVMVEKQNREHFERLKLEDELDLEIEKKNRAANLDPVQGALEQLRIELRERIMGDIKTRIAIPIFHDTLDPAKHLSKRRKLGLPDPSDNDNKGTSLLFNKAGDTSPHTPRGRHGYPLPHAKPLRPHDPNNRRDRRVDYERERIPANAFVDERRRRPAPGPSRHARGLHFRLQQMFDEEENSDDEGRTSLTRDTEDQESRPLSRTSRNSTPFDNESVTETPKHKRRKVTDWEEDEKEIFDGLQKQLLGHLLHKEPEDLATRELELVVNTLPRSSKYASRAKTELFIRQRSKADDDLFNVKSEKNDYVASFIDDVEMAGRDQERTPAPGIDVKAVREKAKKKRKTKKQILEEQEALQAGAREAKAASKPIAQETVTQIEVKELELEAVEELAHADVTWAVTHDKPRRTVEDDRHLVLDVDGWQDIIKDNEDLAFARRALAEDAAYDIGDVKLWAWKQKEIKALNSGALGPVRSETGIDGYYVANSTGSARTEGFKKILNEEKSKYLPHRIKVQKAREELQARLAANPDAVVETVKITAAEKMASTATSRSNRVNNRRLVNDINLQKQNMATVNSDADVAIRFNQLKKRRKLVKFDRSAIHGWGLYAEENIAQNDMIIEYVGEKVRQKVADLREVRYEKQGVGSSYLFRMMDDEIVDATKKGGIARFINHSCNPNCTAKIIKVEGTPRIVIYGLKDIGKNDELTYDYKFEREYGSTDRIPCLCGSANCKGFLN
ncbi:hypothetical protein LTR62_006601 [Meristemomyces frigidus]|uniref:Histone-lysine N-methyltransferase, H3 lysine-4 specific n=1 Tax=Meristemomyces frigidus TaxID=1508187 RepID=A0AAN7YEC9_9PEZI|nr:hypothetical protein LTR62_006601 [Meristemomyces frigidus]